MLPEAELVVHHARTPTSGTGLHRQHSRPWRSAITVSWRWVAQRPITSCACPAARPAAPAMPSQTIEPRMARSARPHLQWRLQALLEIRKGRHIFKQGRAYRTKLRLIDLAAQTACGLRVSATSKSSSPDAVPPLLQRNRIGARSPTLKRPPSRTPSRGHLEGLRLKGEAVCKRRWKRVSPAVTTALHSAGETGKVFAEPRPFEQLQSVLLS